MITPLAAAEPLTFEPPNIQSKTMGGQYFWADELVYFGWRIQRNTFTGHCRLLDEEQRRHIYGTFAQCRAKLEEINPAFIAAFGMAGQQLGKRWAELKPTLATPACEFGIIAGGRGDDHGYNPLLTGDNDGIVTVASTRLTGARDFLLVNELHFFLLRSSTVQKPTLEFLRHGYFVSEKNRQPIKP